LQLAVSSLWRREDVEKMFSPPLHQLKLDITGPLIDIYILGGEKEK
jgi:hypothetical protein